MENKAPPNSYSSQWFEFFHVGIPAARTGQESAFIQQVCPLPSYPRLLDICCGMGRHSRALAAQGYIVTGVDRDEKAIAAARERGGGPTYVQADVRDYLPVLGSFDAVVIMSQSFGYFDADTNGHLLARLGRALRADGRLILDLWNPAFFLPRQGQRSFHLSVGTVQETTRMEGDRLFTRLEYPDGKEDAFEFQTFSPTQMAQFVEGFGLHLLTACTSFNVEVPPSTDNPRIQYVLVRI